MNELKIFKNELFEVSATIENDTVLFDAEMVARCLGFTTVAKSGNEVIRWARVNDYLGENFPQLAKGDLIPEPMVYKLAFKASNETAEKFQDWLAIEVLPTIRKHGAYMTDSVLEQAVSDPDFMIGLLTNLKEEKEKRQLAEETNAKNKPKVLMAETLLASEESNDVGILSTKLQEIGIKNMGRNKLYAYFRDNGYVIKSGERRNLPTQRSIDLKVMEIDVRPYFKGDEICYDSKTKITPKGLEYFINKLGGETI